MKKYNEPIIEIFAQSGEDIVTTSDQQDFLRLINIGGGNTWDVSEAPRE